MPNIAAAILYNQHNKLLICQRPANKPLPLLWEFPGGKIEPMESPKEAAIRECREELNIQIAIDTPYFHLEHQYADFTVSITFFKGTIKSGTPTAIEHPQIKWVTVEELSNYPFCPANTPLLHLLQQEVSHKGR